MPFLVTFKCHITCYKHTHCSNKNILDYLIIAKTFCFFSGDNICIRITKSDFTMHHSLTEDAGLWCFLFIINKLLKNSTVTSDLRRHAAHVASLEGKSIQCPWTKVATAKQTSISNGISQTETTTHWPHFYGIQLYAVLLIKGQHLVK